MNIAPSSCSLALPRNEGCCTRSARCSMVAHCAIILLVGLLILNEIPYLSALGTTTGVVLTAVGALSMLFFSGLRIRCSPKNLSQHQHQNPPSSTHSLNGHPTTPHHAVYSHAPYSADLSHLEVTASGRGMQCVSEGRLNEAEGIADRMSPGADKNHLYLEIGKKYLTLSNLESLVNAESISHKIASCQERNTLLQEIGFQYMNRYNDRQSAERIFGMMYKWPPHIVSL